MKSREIDLEVQICVKEYFDNKCSPEERIPIANQFCLEREKCINRSPENDILILHVGAELFGEFLNKFVETMTMKTIIFTIAISFGLIAMLLKYIEIRHNYKFNKFK